MKPLKRFGQNFLKDPNILNKIAEEINPAEDDLIVEIGPGTGALTERLLKKINTLIAVEIDNRAYAALKEKYPDLNLVNEDILKIDLHRFVKGEGKIRIVGNIPYNITSPIIFKMIHTREIIKDSVLMVQLEVAKRMTGEKGTKDYGILSVLLKYFADVKLRFKVSPNAFFPKPNVDSAVVHLYFKDLKTSKESDKAFIAVVKAAFGNRRKQLKNSFSNSILKDINFENSGIDLSLRAEQLDIKDFVILSDYILSKNYLSQINP
jgi:16S rRNA (adenine1518-N6/adenine1519-N6)-dimethyltransferase